MRLKDKIVLICRRFIYCIIILIPLAISFSSALTNVLIGFLIAAYLFKKLLTKSYLPDKTVINIPFIFFALMTVLSIRNSIDLPSSIHGIFKLVKFGFLFLIFAENIIDIVHFKRVIYSISAGLLLSSLDAVYQLYFGRDFIRNHAYDFVIGLPRLKAAFPHTNIFAIYLGLLLPVCLCCGIYFFKGKTRLFFTIVSILSTFCLIFTFSRGAILGFLVAIIFIAILKKNKALLAAIIVAVIIIPFILPSTVKDWVKNRNSIWEILLDSNGPERIYIYKTSINMIRRHPFIGVGVNTFCGNYLLYKASQSDGNTGEGSYYAHNNFLHMAAEIGIIGLVFFLWLLFALFRKWYIMYRLMLNGLLKICSLGVISGIISFLINGLTESGLYYSKIATLFWVQVGILLALFRIAAENSKSYKEEVSNG